MRSEYSANFCSKVVKWSVMNGAAMFLNSLQKNNRSLESVGPSKIRWLQCYLLLWIHVIDAISMYSLDWYWHYVLHWYFALVLCSFGAFSMLYTLRQDIKNRKSASRSLPDAMPSKKCSESIFLTLSKRDYLAGKLSWKLDEKSPFFESANVGICFTRTYT